MDPVVVAAIVGGIAGAFGSVLANESVRRDREWNRDTILTAYSECIYYLIKLSIATYHKPTDDTDDNDKRG